VGGQGVDDETDIVYLSQPQNTDQAPSINEANLFELTSEQTSKLNYPIGCPVWYNKHHHAQSSNRFDVRHGTVISVLMDVMSRKFFYRVEKMKNVNDLLDTAHDVLPRIELVWEDKIVFAPKCPVLVQKMMDGDMKEVEGEIVCPRSSVTCNDDIVDINTTYTIMYFLEDNKLEIEDGVLPHRIKFLNTKTVVVGRDERATQVSDRQSSNHDKRTTSNISVIDNCNVQQTTPSKTADRSSQKYEEIGIMQSKIPQASVSEAAPSSGTVEKTVFNQNPLMPRKRNLTSTQSSGDDGVNEHPEKIPRKCAMLGLEVLGNIEETDEALEQTEPVKDDRLVTQEDSDDKNEQEGEKRDGDEAPEESDTAGKIESTDADELASLASEAKNDDAQPKAEENGGAEDLGKTVEEPAMAETDTIPVEKPPVSSSKLESNQWECKACTYLNYARSRKCQMCKAKRDAPKKGWR